MRKTFKKWKGFTLAELLVVIAVLTVLATVGFLAMSGYSSDAKNAAVASNVRTVYSAITSESALTGHSPRYYVIHDPNYALSGGTVVFDGNPIALSGGDWDAPGTNYSAGNPDYAKLKISKDKFKIASNGGRVFAELFSVASATGTADPAYLLVGAAETSEISASGKKRIRSAVQVAAIPSTGKAVVTGSYSGQSGAVAGLVRDPGSASSTGSLVDGVATGAPPTCGPGYALGAGMTCVEVVSGSCGTAGGTATYSYPASAFCAQGTVNGTDTVGMDGTFDWTCQWSNGGPNASCSAPRSFYASCNAIKTATSTNVNTTYAVDPDGTGGVAPYDAYCDMTTDGGGWTLLGSALKNGTGSSPINWTVATDSSTTSADPLGGNSVGSWGTTNAKLKPWNSLPLTTVMVRENSNYDKMTFSTSGTFAGLLAGGTLSSYTNVSLNFNTCNNASGYCWNPAIGNALRTPSTQPCGNAYFNAGNQGINLVWYHDGYCNSGGASYANKGFFTKWYAGVQETSQTTYRISTGVSFWGK